MQSRETRGDIIRGLIENTRQRNWSLTANEAEMKRKRTFCNHGQDGFSAGVITRLLSSPFFPSCLDCQLFMALIYKDVAWSSRRKLLENKKIRRKGKTKSLVPARQARSRSAFLTFRDYVLAWFIHRAFSSVFFHLCIHARDKATSSTDDRAGKRYPRVIDAF